MAKPKKMHKCSSCGYTTVKWVGQCPSCKEWSTLEEYIEPVGTPASVAARAISSPVTAVKLKDVSAQETTRIITGIGEFDRVVGGGLVNDSMTILAGCPGVGSTANC